MPTNARVCTCDPTDEIPDTGPLTTKDLTDFRKRCDDQIGDWRVVGMLLDEIERLREAKDALRDDLAATVK